MDAELEAILFGPESALPEHIPDAGDAPLEFSVEELMSAEKLKSCSLFTRLVGWYMSQHGNAPEGIELPEHKRKLSRMLPFYAAVGTLGASLVDEGEWGILDMAAAKEMMALNPMVIKASISHLKREATHDLTDANIIALAISLKGTEVHAEGLNMASIRAVGAPRLDVRLEGGTLRLSVKGGEEWASWYSHRYGVRARYMGIHTHVLTLARYLVSKKKVKITNDGITFSHHILQGGAYDVFAEFPQTANRYEAWTKFIEEKILAPGYAHVDMRPSFGYKIFPIEYIAWIMQKQIPFCTPGVQAAMVKVAEGIHTMAEDVWGKIKTSYPKWFGVDDMPTLHAMARNLAVGAVLPCTKGLACKTYGGISEWVELHRKQVRADGLIDVPRKSDAGGIGSVAGSATSVPAKLGAAVRELMKMDPAANTRDREGWGTAKFAHFRHIVMDTTGAASFHDKEARFLPEGTGCRVAAEDILAIPPGTKRGKTIIDDTFIEGKGGAQNLQKFRSIMSAGYTSGVVKLYLGAPDLGKDDPLGSLPPLIATAIEECRNVVLCQGGGAHSQEFFLVFSKVEGIVVVPEFGKPSTVVSTERDPTFEDKVRTGSRLRAWLLGKCVDMVRGNVYQSVQARMGHLLDKPMLPTITPHPSPTVIRCAGTVDRGAIVSEAAISVVNLDEIEF